MAIVATNLDSAAQGAGNTKVTNSISPAANSLIIVSVQSFRSGGNPLAPTITGAGMTWVQIATLRSASDSQWRITLFRGMSTSPGSGALTIDYGGTNDQCQYAIDQFTGVDISGTNGSGAIVQSASNDNAGSQTGITVTLGAFSNINNVAYGAVVLSSTNPAGGITPGGGFVELVEFVGNGRNETEWKNANATSVSWSWSSASNSTVAMALEIKALSGGNFLPFL